MRRGQDGNQRVAGKGEGPADLRSRIFDLGWVLWTMMFAPAIPLLWVAGSPPRAVRKLTRLWARGALALLRWIVGLDFREIGRRHIPAEPCLIVCNHQSAFETIAALVLFPEVAIVAKHELSRIPILGWFLRRSPMIIIDRDSAAQALRQMVAEGARALAAGRSVLIFPEGTRQLPDDPVSFKRGVELLYKRLAVPVLPVVVNSGRYWTREPGGKRAGKITMSYLPAIPPGGDPAWFVAFARHAIEHEKSRLEKAIGSGA